MSQIGQIFFDPDKSKTYKRKFLDKEKINVQISFEECPPKKLAKNVPKQCLNLLKVHILGHFG